MWSNYRSNRIIQQLHSGKLLHGAQRVTTFHPPSSARKTLYYHLRYHNWREKPADDNGRLHAGNAGEKKGLRRGPLGGSGGAGGNRTPVRKPLSGRSTRLAD